MAANKATPNKIEVKQTNPAPKKPPKKTEVCVYTNVCDIKTQQNFADKIRFIISVIDNNRRLIIY